MKQTDRYLRRLDKRYLNSRLTERLKKQGARRWVVVMSVFVLLTTGFLVGFGIWSVLAPDPMTPIVRILRAFFWVALVAVGQLEPLLRLSIRSAIAWPGQQFDERQQQLNTNARSDTRSFELSMFGLALLAGMGTIVAVWMGEIPSAHPHYGGIPLYAGVGTALFSLAKNAPHMLLAWQLPDEPKDGEGDDHG